MTRTNRHGLAVLDAPSQTRRHGDTEIAASPRHPVPASDQHPIRCINQWHGCKHLGLYVTRRGLACPDCLPAVLVNEERTR